MILIQIDTLKEAIHDDWHVVLYFKGKVAVKVIIEKSRGEGSLMEQDTIENVSYPNFFLTF